MPSVHQQWWENLSPEWQQVFCISVLQKNTTPSQQHLEAIWNMAVIRLAGPTAPHPNCSIELSDLSGLSALKQLQILIVSHHAITGLQEIKELKNLKSLFVFNNKISSLAGIEKLQQLEQLYVNSNELVSIKELAALPQLVELNISDNRLTSLEGLTEAHADHLKLFTCMPNAGLKPKEILRVENELGLLCRR